MGKKFFEYSQHFGGRSYKDLTPEEKKKYNRISTSNFAKTRTHRIATDLYNNKKEDMMILYFLNNVVSNKQAFIKRVLWAYILNNAPEYVDKLEDFKFDNKFENYDYAMKTRNNNKLYEYNGVQNSLKAWSELLDLPYPTMSQRINTHKWSLEKAFTTPIKPTHSNHYIEKETITREALIELTEKIKRGEIDFPIKNDNKRPKQRDYSGIKFADPAMCTKDISLEELNNETFKDLLYKREVIK